MSSLMGLHRTSDNIGYCTQNHSVDSIDRNIEPSVSSIDSSVNINDKHQH